MVWLTLLRSDLFILGDGFHGCQRPEEKETVRRYITKKRRKPVQRSLMWENRSWTGASAVFISNPWIYHPMPYPEPLSCSYSEWRISPPLGWTSSFSSCPYLSSTGSFYLDLACNLDFIDCLVLQHLSAFCHQNLLWGISIKIHSRIVFWNLAVVYW